MSDDIDDMVGMLSESLSLKMLAEILERLEAMEIQLGYLSSVAASQGAYGDVNKLPGVDPRTYAYGGMITKNNTGINSGKITFDSQENLARLANLDKAIEEALQKNQSELSKIKYS